MKKVFYLLVVAAVALMAAGCSTLRDAVYQTEAEDAAIICVANSSYTIDVTVDKNQYHIKTVKEKDLDRKRNLKHAADNMVYITPGNHRVVIRRNGRVVYDERIHARPDETKLIYL